MQEIGKRNNIFYFEKNPVQKSCLQWFQLDFAQIVRPATIENIQMSVHTFIPAMIIEASPVRIDWAARATERRPDPQTILTPIAGTVSGRPAFIEACLAGFCPCPQVSTWPNMTSEMSSGATLVVSSNAFITFRPSSWLGTEDKLPLSDPKL